MTLPQVAASVVVRSTSRSAPAPPASRDEQDDQELAGRLSTPWRGEDVTATPGGPPTSRPAVTQGTNVVGIASRDAHLRFLADLQRGERQLPGRRSLIFALLLAFA